MIADDPFTFAVIVADLEEAPLKSFQLEVPAVLGYPAAVQHAWRTAYLMLAPSGLEPNQITVRVVS